MDATLKSPKLIKINKWFDENSPFPIAVTINDREPFVVAVSFHCTGNTFHVRVCCRAGGQCNWGAPCAVHY